MSSATIPVKKTEIPPAEKIQPVLRGIMVATDFSPVSDRALQFAVALARRFGSRIFLTHILTYDGPQVMEMTPTEDTRRAAEQNIARIEKTGVLFGVPYTTIIEEGTLWLTLEELLRKYEADLLVMGTHRMGTVGKLLAGSMAEEVFRQSRVPVLTVGPAAKEEPQFEAEFRNILFATDFGVSAEKAAAFAFALAQEHRSKLTVVHVLTKKEAKGADVLREREMTVRVLQNLLPPDSPLRCQPSFVVAYGQPGEEILRTASAVNADLIIMGAKSREGLAGHVPHTKAYAVVCGAKCPVLTFKS